LKPSPVNSGSEVFEVLDLRELEVIFSVVPSEVFFFLWDDPLLLVAGCRFFPAAGPLVTHVACLPAER